VEFIVVLPVWAEVVTGVGEVGAGATVEEFVAGTEQLVWVQFSVLGRRVVLRQPTVEAVQLTHTQPSVVPHESHNLEGHSSDSVAADAPMRARTTVKNTTFEPMTADNLLLWRVRRGKQMYLKRNVEVETS